jgi:hypothetical protein
MEVAELLGDFAADGCENSLVGMVLELYNTVTAWFFVFDVLLDPHT